MKKAWLAVLAIPVLAYPAASWFVGSKVQSVLDKQYKEMENVPYYKVERKYERGIFSATDDVTLVLFEELATNAKEDGKKHEPLRLHFVSHIKHGPFAGGEMVGAVMDTELVLDDEKVKAEVKRIFGDAKPLAAHTVVQFDGSGATTLKLAPFNSDFDDSASGKKLAVNWGGFEGNFSFTAGLERTTVQGSSPKLEINDAEGNRVAMSGLRIDGEDQRILPDEPLLRVGGHRLSIESMEIVPGEEGAPHFKLGKVNVVTRMPVKGEFLDVEMRSGAEVLDVAGTNYGPIRYDLSLKRLHLKTYAQLNRAMVDLYKAAATIEEGDNPTAMFAPLAEPAKALLAYDPELSLDRISFQMPDGEANLAARVSLPGVKPADLDNPLLLLARLSANASVALPESLLTSAISSCKPFSKEGEGAESCPSEEEVMVKTAQMHRQVEAMAAQGYVTREGNVLKTSAEFKSGQLQVNGKPFNPLAMAANMSDDDAAPADEEGVPAVEAEGGNAAGVSANQ